MNAYSKLSEPSRHRIEHAMILSDDQIQRMGALDLFCTMQPEFLMRFAHSYKRQLGAERTSLLKRARSVKDAGIKLSFSSDRPIVAGDPRDGIRTAVNRPPGFDPSESVLLEEAILAYTEEGAKANGDGKEMGSLLPGQFADYQLCDSLSGFISD
jgi:predicted amidohydrolase YtcJ